jgi:hypothetical protein
MIDYELLGLAVKQYQDVGYNQIEVPWRISDEILNISKPLYVKTPNYKLEGTAKSLIASGEQGFMYLMAKGQLGPGLYQTITPCFRNEPHDELHQKQFMKVELIHVHSHSFLSPEDNAEVAEEVIIGAALDGFTTLLFKVFEEAGISKCPEDYLKVVPTGYDDPIAVKNSVQQDIVLTIGAEEYELGSYGSRQAAFGSWTYGTGVALPRFSVAARKLVQALR